MRCFVCVYFLINKLKESMQPELANKKNNAIMNFDKCMKTETG